MNEGLRPEQNNYNAFRSGKESSIEGDEITDEMLKVAYQELAMAGGELSALRALDERWPHLSDKLKNEIVAKASGDYQVDQSDEIAGRF